MKIRSLQAQVSIVLLVLAVTLLTQLFFARNSLSTLVENQSSLTQSHSHVGVVYELERDVIDLQRNLLIYKATGSDSAIHRFHTIMELVDEQILKLSKEVGEGKQYLINEESFARMVSHLADYELNFTSVINAKAKQESAIERIDSDISSIDQYISQKRTQVSIDVKSEVVGLREIMSDYLATFNPLDISRFNKKTSNVISQFTRIKYLDGVEKAKNIKKEFRRLIQLTRGYQFLVNVVMAGSANEFLFLTKKIREAAIEKQELIELEAEKSAKQAQFINSVISVLSILIIISIAWFLSREIIFPIKNITDIFTVLSKGDDIDSIPSVNRNDEIGDLARAAEVFHKNNSLTKQLLVESQDMIATQEVLNIQLEQQKKKAELAAKSKSDFLANMSHEIRTPMNGIVGLVDLVLKTKLTNKQKQYLDRISYSGQIMMNVINDILDFSKIEAGKMEIESVELDINTIIENLISSMMVRIYDKQLDFKVWVSPNVPKKIIGDPLRISQVLLNLCSNSIKFTDSGSIIIKFDFINNQLYFSVHDTGIGMTQAQLDSIFESFTQADGSISRKYGGTGLGLSIVKKLIELMHGDIKVESTVDVGTEIYVSISCDIADQAPLLTPLTGDLPSIHYAGRNGKPSYIKYVFEQLHIPLIDISTIQDAQVMTTGQEQFVLFEGIKSLPASYLSSCLESKVKLFCVLNANEIDEKEKVKAMGDITVLQHPFSPNQYERFFSEIFGVNPSSILAAPELVGDAHAMTGHVLLVEDNPINQLVAGDMLEGLGVTYDLAEDGIQAVKAVKGKEYDLVFMDVQMPKMDGYTATKTLREAGYDDVIICGLSANALKEDLEKAEQSGMNDYLTKPLILDSLKALLEKYLIQS